VAHELSLKANLRLFNQLSFRQESPTLRFARSKTALSLTSGAPWIANLSWGGGPRHGEMQRWQFTRGKLDKADTISVKVRAKKPVSETGFLQEVSR
jgi:hypothetical protein